MKNLYFILFLVFSTFGFGQTNYTGNQATGFGNPVGESTLDINHTGTTITGTFTKGTDVLNDIIVIYISNGTSGRKSINFNDNDQSDDLRRAVTNAFGQAINFPAGFEATHAIAIKVNNNALFRFPASGDIGTGSGNNELIFEDFVGNPTSNTQASFTFSFDWSEIGLTSADNFGFVITYGNGSGGANNDAMFSSDEGYGDGIPTPNPEFNGWSYTTYFDYPSGDIGGLAISNQGGFGDWSSPSAWLNGNVPLSGDEVIIISSDLITLDQDANVSSLTTNSGGFLGALNFDSGGRTLVIREGGNIENNGSFGAGNGTVSFLGAGTVSGSSVSTVFENVDIAGGVDFGSNSEIDGELTIESGGFVVNLPPRYSSNSTLIYSDDGNPYGRGLEWSSLTGRGYPNNVIIRDNTTLILGANSGTGTRRQCRGSLTVESGSALTLAGPNMTQSLTVLGNYINNGTTTLSSSIGGDLVLRGNFDDDGIFTANGRAVFFEGGNTQNITSATNPLEIDVMRINKTGGEVVMGQNLLVDETADPLDFSSATSHLNLSGHTLTIGKAGVTSNVAMASGSEIRGSTTSGLVVLGNGDLGTINLGSGATATLGNLDINRGAGGSVTIDSDLIIETTGNVRAGNSLEVTGNLTNNGNITFESDATGSGQLDTFTGTLSGSGEVTVERYIPANRAYRLLSSPVTTSGTIFENWQENGIYPISANGIGTHITGSQGTVGQFDASSGLDQTASGNKSMFTFDNTFVPTGAQTQFDGWNEVASTNQTGDNLNAETPYLLFVRGDRSIDLASNSSTPNNTTLSATGNLFTGLSTQTLSGQPDYFSLVANPFQAIVDFNALTFTGLGNPNFMYVYDPAQKDYVTLDANVPAEVPDMFIRPGQSVFVVNSPGTATASTVQFEQIDINTSPSPGPGTTVFSDDFMAKLELELYNGSGELRENLRISFEDNASNAIDEFDAPKLTGGSEILASVNSGNIYTIERRAQVQSTDQVSILLDQYQGTDYEFRVTLENWNPDVEIFVADNYLGSTTQITPGQAYVFTVDSSIPESISENRFSLVFDNTTLGVDDNTFGSDFALYPNPTTDGQFSIKTPNLSGEVDVEITSLLGQNLFSKQLQVVSNQVDVNAQNLSTGIYVVRLTQGNQSFSTKLIVE